MTLPIVLRPEARAEFDEAFDWYERQARPDWESSSPDAYRPSSTGSRRCPSCTRSSTATSVRALVRKFPYCGVLPRSESGQVVVLAVFHGKRDPELWKSRI